MVARVDQAKNIKNAVLTSSHLSNNQPKEREK